MKFAQFPDCHLGSWSSQPDMREYPLQAFEKAVGICIKEKVDFILQCGDFFDTSIPGIDALRKAAAVLRKCKEAGIRFYAINGSHDFSPTGKTMLSVLEDAGLLMNVAKGVEENGKFRLSFTEDPSGARLTGIVGMRNALDSEYFRKLDRSIERGSGMKIFAFHAAITECRPEGMKLESMPMSLLPKGFDHYASGHVHKRLEWEYEGRKVMYAGVLFPTSFDELENYESGFYIFEDGDMRWLDMRLFETKLIRIDADGKRPEDIEREAREKLEGSKGKFVLLRVAGTLESGKPTDIDFHSIINEAIKDGAISIKINRNALTTKEFEEIKIRHSSSIEDMEREIISEHESQIKMAGIENSTAVRELMRCLKAEKQENENASLYEERIISEAKKVLEI
ncbi:MAG: metallophosphoesterase [Candidatus Aenigmarchaeota archaeon]|nr:metallophosphoesterase [Candidatus Aenigmarchaeota archaeon]